MALVCPLRVRGLAMGVCLLVNWGSNFLTSLTFLNLIEADLRTTAGVAET